MCKNRREWDHNTRKQITTAIMARQKQTHSLTSNCQFPACKSIFAWSTAHPATFTNWFIIACCRRASILSVERENEGFYTGITRREFAATQKHAAWLAQKQWRQDFFVAGKRLTKTNALIGRSNVKTGQGHHARPIRCPDTVDAR